MELRTLRDKATEAFAKGRFSKAAEIYEEYCEADPKDLQARLRMGDAWAKSGQYPKAIKAYQGAAEGFAREGFLPRAIAASKLILELDPKHRGVQQMLADLYARRGTPMSSAPRRRPAEVAAPEPTAEAPLELVTTAVVAPPRPLVPPPPPEDSRPAPVSDASELDFSSALPPELALPEKKAPPPPPTAAMRMQRSRSEEVEVDVEVVPPEALSDEVLMSEPPPAPAIQATPLPAPAAPRPVEPAKAPASTLPPGLAPRSAQRPPAAAPSAPPPAAQAAPAEPTSKKSPWVAASSLLTSTNPAAQTAPPSVGAPPGLRPRGAEEPRPPAPAPAPAPAAAQAARELVLEDVPAPRASIQVSSFTELELEADTLLHAVEMAALEGMRQRASAPAEGSSEQEETVFSITEEFIEDAPSLDALPNIPLFSDLPRDAFIELFERCPLRRFNEGERIIEQGTQGDAFYVICEGRVRVFREEGGEQKQLALLESGTFFGEMALLSEAPRTASVEGAAEDTQLLEISAAVLAELSGRYPQVARALKKFCRERLLSNVMNSSPLFKLLGRKDRRELIERFRARDVPRNEVIIRDGERTDGLYVVLSGEVEVHKQNQLLTRLREGDLFGEISLLQKTPATATVTTSRHTTLLRLPREDFDRLIMSYPQILALVSELTDERLKRTERVLGTTPQEEAEPEYDEDMILV